MRETVTCELEELGDVIIQMFDEFNQEVCDGMKDEAEKAVDTMVEGTQADAPRDRPRYANAITSDKLEETPTSITYAWYVKPPNHRLTHLLAWGHQLTNGGRTAGDPFLANNYEKAKEQYEKGCEKVIDDAAG